MKIDTLENRSGKWEILREGIEEKGAAQLVCIFGDTDTFKDPVHYHAIRTRYPEAHIVGCSSSGHVIGDELSEAELIGAAVHFEHGAVKVSTMRVGEQGVIPEEVAQMVKALEGEGLRHIFVLSDGLRVNGSELVRGINAVAPAMASGGMAGDGARFQETWVMGDGEPQQNQVVAIGFYGEALKISSGSFAGWSEFGADRIVTRSVGNVLYELDGQPALELYKSYLGPYADDLPNSGMRFPLSIREQEADPEVIRTLLAIDEAENSITFAGDIPEGYIARLMKPDIDALVEGAGKAAELIDKVNEQQALALVVSCVGRKVVMNQMIDEELDEVQTILGDNVQLVGFYSYGEISPSARGGLWCDLHNQTMTLTVIYEA